MTSGGLWLGTGSGCNGFRPTYRLILKSATAGPIDSLVLKSQLENFMQTSNVNSVFDAFTTTELSPSIPSEEWEINTSFEYTDAHVLSSQATKLLVDKTVMQSNTQSNTTITHYTPIEAGERIDDYEVGKPVFLSGHIYKQVNGQRITST